MRAKLLNFNKLKKANKIRCIHGFKHELSSWTPDQWTNAIAGETGEACNFAKKLNRLLNGTESKVPILKHRDRRRSNRQKRKRQ